MDKLIMNRYYRKLKYINLEIDLEFKSEITIICGDNTTEKTLIYKLLGDEPSKYKIKYSTDKVVQMIIPHINQITTPIIFICKTSL